MPVPYFNVEQRSEEGYYDSLSEEETQEGPKEAGEVRSDVVDRETPEGTQEGGE